ncbi:transposase [Chryseobacterium arthrosphaerae]|uniref:transposase n=1 Tax=Chryseobacterium arthrosphaerae TaxID=651561 RepID=UPI003D357140
MSRIVKFFDVKPKEIEQMYNEKSLDTEVLIRWCKLLEYDFFRIYSHHIILFSPPSSVSLNKSGDGSLVPRFRKNIYSKEIIEFILEMIRNGEKTKKQVFDDYGIPKTTLYKWIEKYSN